MIIQAQYKIEYQMTGAGVPIQTMLLQTYGNAAPNAFQNGMQNTYRNKDFRMNSEFHRFIDLRKN